MAGQKNNQTPSFLRLSDHRYDEPVCSLCPCPSLTAYWTPPPAWPRRFLGKSKLCPLMCGSRWSWTAAVIMVFIYFLVMDIILFIRYSSVNLADESSVGRPDEIYTPFTHLSVKGMLNDHPSQFFIAPSTEYFNMITHFSSVFSFITPNIISVAHLICGFIACKFIASDQLLDRRIGVVLFEYRTWLDAFDGTVHRAQQGLHLQYHSNHSTIGYVIDSACDTLAGFFLSFGIFFYLLKRFTPNGGFLPLSQKDIDHSLSNGSGLCNGHAKTGQEIHSARYLFLKCLSLGMCLAVTGKGWDQSVEDFSQVFQTRPQDQELHYKQVDMSHSLTTMVIFYLWRLFGGQSVLNYILIAIFMDKIWEFMQYSQYVLILVATVLFIITAIYIHQVSAGHCPLS